MSTVEEIERAAEQLPAPDFARLAAWMDTRRHVVSTRRAEDDISTGAPVGSLKHLLTPERDAEELAIQKGCTCEAPEEFPR